MKSPTDRPLKNEDTDNNFSGQFIKSLPRFIDATAVTALVTAMLYFWGYAYYREFCEKLGVRFYGFNIPTRDYLVASWRYAILSPIMMFFLLLLGRWVGEFIEWIFRKASKKRKSDLKNNESKSMHSIADLRFVIMLFYTILVFLLGIFYMIEDADTDAMDARMESRKISIRDNAGEIIQGSYVYLRDFGETLLVEERSENFEKVTGIRIFKQGAISSYILLESSPPH